MNMSSDSTLSDRLVATFHPGTNGQLSMSREPFKGGPCYKTRNNKNLTLRFDCSTVMIRYLQALFAPDETQTSIKLLEPKEGLPSRCRALCSSMRALWKASWENPYILTPAWLEQASRVKRRATTNGGADDSLLKHAVATIFKQPSTLQKCIKEEETWRELERERGEMRAKWLRRFSKELGTTVENDTSKPTNVSWEYNIWMEMERMCMFNGDTFTVSWSYDDPFVRSTRQPKPFEVILDRELSSIAEGLSEESPGSWCHSLSQIPEFLEILRLPHRIEDIPVVVLELTTEHKLWHSTCLIRG